MSYRAIIFDLYDTLVWLDEPLSNERRNRLAARLGVKLEQFMAVWRRSVDQRMLGHAGTLADQMALSVSELGIRPEPALMSELLEIEQRRLEDCVHLYPNAVPVLKKLAADGYRLALLSNLSDGAAIPIYHLGIDDLFHEMVLSHEVGLLKPDPAIFQLACERLGSPPEETMFVADGGFGELDAAQKLGIFSVYIEQQYQTRYFGESTSYDAKIGDLTELEPLIADHR